MTEYSFELTWTEIVAKTKHFHFSCISWILELKRTLINKSYSFRTTQSKDRFIFNLLFIVLNLLYFLWVSHLKDDKCGKVFCFLSAKFSSIIHWVSAVRSQFFSWEMEQFNLTLIGHGLSQTFHSVRERNLRDEMFPEEGQCHPVLYFELTGCQRVGDITTRPSKQIN